MSQQQPMLQCAGTADGAIKLTLGNSVATGDLLTIILGGFTNPSSGARTGPFQVTVYDSDYFDIASAQDSLEDLSMQMTQPYLITNGGTLKIDTDVPTSVIFITIQFTLAHDIPAQAKLVVTYPSQLSPNQTTLQVISPQTTANNGVYLVAGNRQIVGDGFFTIAKLGGQVIELQIAGFKNPSFSTPTDAFSVEIFTSEGYVIDRLQQSSLQVKSKCDYPCKDCGDGSKPTICTACMTEDMSPLTLLEESKCVESCRAGFYVLGNICDRCDPSCGTCDGSKLVCKTCPTNDPQHKYLYNSQCVSGCDPGYFRNDLERTCDKCEAPCQTCDKSTTSCSSCQAGYFLFRSGCLLGCPKDNYIENSDNWTCDRCDNECITCQKKTNQCTSCKPGYRLNMLNSTCFAGECPLGVTVEQTPGICSVCEQQCLTCGNGKANHCLTCQDNLFYAPETNDCLVACLGDQAIFNGTEDGSGIKKCINCKQGCTACMPGHPQVCTACKPGLVNFNFTDCLSECPQYFADLDGTGLCVDTRIHCPYGYVLNNVTNICELGVQECLEGYELSKYFNRCIPLPGLSVPFPTIFVVLVITTIILIRVFRHNKKLQLESLINQNNDSKALALQQQNNIQKHRTKIVPTLIVAWSWVEFPLFLAQAAFSANFEHWFNLSLTFIAIVFHIILNCVGVRIILPGKLLDAMGTDESDGEDEEEKSRFKAEAELDVIFKHWAQHHLGFIRWLRRFAQWYNMKFLRALYCNYLGRGRYMAVFEHSDKRLHKPLLRHAVVYMILVYLPLIIADVTVLKTIVRWGYQFTILCIESLLFSIAMSIMLILDYCQQRKIQLSFFKVNAKQMMPGQSVFAAVGDSILDDDSVNGLIMRQRSTERHVRLLQQLNEELEHWKIYSGNFDKLQEYAREIEEEYGKVHSGSPGGGKRGKWWSPPKKREFKEDDNDSVSSRRCLSTQGHYGNNKKGFFDYPELPVLDDLDLTQRGYESEEGGDTRRIMDGTNKETEKHESKMEHRSGLELKKQFAENPYANDPRMEHMRPYHSEMSEDDYPLPQRLNSLREEIDELMRKWLEEDAARTKTLDYKASFNILDTARNASAMSRGDSTELNPGGDKTLNGDHSTSGLYVLQRPPRFNLSDVMGHFETDNQGNLVIVKKSVGPQSPRETYLVDALGRRVNRRGYLIDNQGNVVNKFGDLVVKADLDPLTDDIPPEVFRELFIPQQIQADTSNSRTTPGLLMDGRRRRKRASTGKHRTATTSLIHKNNTTSQHLNSNMSKSRDTAIVSKRGGQRNIVMDGSEKRVSIEVDDYEDDEDDYVNNGTVGSHDVSGKESLLHHNSGQQRVVQFAGDLPPKKGKRGAVKRGDLAKNKKTQDTKSKSRSRSRSRAPLSEEDLEGPGEVQINIEMKAGFVGKKASSRRSPRRQSQERSSGRQRAQPNKKKPNIKPSIRAGDSGKTTGKQNTVTSSVNKPLKKVTLKSPEVAKDKVEKMIHDIEDNNAQQKPVELSSGALLESMIKEATQPKVPKLRPSTLNNWTAKMSQPRKKESGPFDPTLYRIHLDVEEQIPSPKKEEKPPLPAEVIALLDSAKEPQINSEEGDTKPEEEEKVIAVEEQKEIPLNQEENQRDGEEQLQQLQLVYMNNSQTLAPYDEILQIQPLLQADIQQQQQRKPHYTLQQSLDQSSSAQMLHVNAPLKGGWMQQDQSLLSSQDQPLLNTGKGTNVLNISGRLIMRDPSQERYASAIQPVDGDMISRFYPQQRPPSSSANPNSSLHLISPATSIKQMNHGYQRPALQVSFDEVLSFNSGRPPLPGGRYMTPPDAATGHQQQIRHPSKNNVSSAYSQNLTLLMNAANQQPKRAKKKDDSDPFAQLKKIFSNNK